jgi:hypothetical protein
MLPILLLLSSCITIPNPGNLSDTYLVGKICIITDKNDTLSLNEKYKDNILLYLEKDDNEIMIETSQNGYINTNILLPGIYRIKRIKYQNRTKNLDKSYENYQISILNGKVNNLGFLVWPQTTNTLFQSLIDFEKVKKEYCKSCKWKYIDWIELRVNKVPINEIGKIYWLIINRPQNFFQNNEFGGTCFLTCSFQMKNKIIDGSIKRAYFTNGKEQWDLDIFYNIDFEHNLIGKNRQYFVQNDLQYLKSNAFRIGRIDFIIVFFDNSQVIYNLDIPQPNSVSSDGFNYVYTEDASLILDNVYKAIACIKRPIITEYKFKDNQLVVKFSENDNRIFTGGIVFFDKNNKVISETDLFINPINNNVSAYVNNGSSLYTDGSTNEYNINMESLKMAPNQTIQDIVGFYIVITDGKQYINNEKYIYDNISYSSRCFF